MHRTAAIVCGAGVSSTFVARAMRTLASERGLEWQIEPLAVDQVAHHPDSLGLVLVGNHLADHVTHLQSVVAPSGVSVVLLNSDDVTAAAEQGVALMQLHEAERAERAGLPSKGNPHG